MSANRLLHAMSLSQAAPLVVTSSLVGAWIMYRFGMRSGSEMDRATMGPTNQFEIKRVNPIDEEEKVSLSFEEAAASGRLPNEPTVLPADEILLPPTPIASQDFVSSLFSEKEDGDRSFFDADGKIRKRPFPYN
eukprot:TRINITY_DN956_c0_g1_i3.p1 TRINITY_DN956_c0_g1~~TRINITY_DN956_c0_g1_i3.p1  ORF type:complete len:134 (+),score=19.58 TRINITY_DN956_c0_g1_i3:2-403(+)